MDTRGLVLIPRPDPSVPASSVRDVLESWLDGRNESTARAYASDLGDFARYLRIRGNDPAAAAVERLLSLAPGEANRVALAYKADLTKRGLKSATIARRLAALRSMVRMGRRIGRINWTLDVDTPKVVPYRDCAGPGHPGWLKILGKAFELAKQDAEGKRNLAMILLGHDLVLRRGSVVAMDLDDVDLDNEVIWVISKGKTDPERRTLSEDARDALRDWIAARGPKPGPLFIRLDPACSPSDLLRLSGVSANRMIRRLSRLAGLSRECRFHGLRHEGITTALDASDGDIRGCQALSGHAKTETLLRYDDQRRDRAGSLAKLVGSRNSAARR
jgi:integrase/recombinase XerC